MSHHQSTPGMCLEVRDMNWRLTHMVNANSGVVCKSYLDDTLPFGRFETTVECLAPFTRQDREADYAEAWAFFEAEKRPSSKCITE
ncbi:hypothetical protein [Halomonas cerina]|uniref:Uncharacterized protein n=1 Tax=Halomonas cerina TaxID=447424 RepID=A0A839V3Q7_9GAMM|nr:hypothetical protein [Halomonas cerina]MBB3190012.1 hypothetical protein [Halomonas cerina]